MNCSASVFINIPTNRGIALYFVVAYNKGKSEVRLNLRFLICPDRLLFDIVELSINLTESTMQLTTMP